MFLILGMAPRDRVLVVVIFMCEFCGALAPQNVIESATKLSVFFVPLVTVSRRHFVTCTNCGGTTALTREQATHGLDWAARNRRVG